MPNRDGDPDVIVVGRGSRCIGMCAKVMSQSSSDPPRDAWNGFPARLGHELRTPLNAILGFGECIAGGMAGELNEKYRSYGEHVVSAGRRLLHVIDDVLDLPWQRRVEQLLSLRAIVETARAEASAHVQARIEIPPGLNLYADETVLKRILVWLLESGATQLRAHVSDAGDLALDVAGSKFDAESDHRRALLEALVALCHGQLRILPAAAADRDGQVTRISFPAWRVRSAPPSSSLVHLRPQKARR